MDNFFQQWGTYRTIVTQGYMGHQDISHCVLNALQQLPGGLEILDLGCGDAEVFFHLTSELAVGHYKGVDSSAAALDFLTERFKGKRVAFQLYRQDMMQFLQQCQDRFDIILAGYCIHHLSFDKKQHFLQMAYRCLREQGVMFIYDVFLQSGESREQYLANYLAYMRSNWTVMSTAEQEALDAHVIGCDFPEEVKSYRLWAEEAGFQKVDSLWEGEWHSHKLLQLSRVPSG